MNFDLFKLVDIRLGRYFCNILFSQTHSVEFCTNSKFCDLHAAGFAANGPV